MSVAESWVIFHFPSHRTCAEDFSHFSGNDYFVWTTDRTGKILHRADLEIGDHLLDAFSPMVEDRLLFYLSNDRVKKLAILIAPPHKHLTRYHGVFAPAHRLRAKVVPAPSPHNVSTTTTLPSSKPPNRIAWSELLRRVFAIDILICDQCRGPMKIIAVIPSSSIADKILNHLRLEISQAATGPPTTLH